MSIPSRFLDELRDALPASSVIGRRVHLSRAGREYKACCPFHNEKTPSFYINDDKQFYHCFGCGAHGDIIGFVMDHDNLPFHEAVEALAGQAGLQVPRPSREEAEKAEKAKSLYDVMETAARFCQRSLEAPDAEAARQYLSERGIDANARAEFRIGYAPADGQAMRRHLREQGVSDQQMREAGLLKDPARGNGEPYIFFRERIMFPVTDKRGRVVAFGGRILPDYLRRHAADPNTTPPKYINSPDTPIFHKGRMLYGAAQARRAARADKPVIVVEGYMDVIACARAGFDGAVAPLGTALTEEQIFALWRMMPDDGVATPYLCFDGDDAGKRAAERACMRILPHLGAGKSVRLVFMPGDSDPDTLLRHRGAEAFRGYLDASVALIDFLWELNTSGRDFSTPEARAALSERIEELAGHIRDRQVQYHYRQAFRDKMRRTFGNTGAHKQGTDARSLKGGQGRRSDSQPEIAVPRPQQGRFETARMVLLATMINHPALYNEFEGAFEALQFEDPEMARLHAESLAFFHDYDMYDLDRQAICYHLGICGLSGPLDRLLSDSLYLHAGFARPEVAYETARSGWHATSEFITRRAAWQELQQAGQALARDMDEDNEQRFMAMYAYSANAGEDGEGPGE
jgi:DNA primase